MGMTMTQKILASAAGLDEVHAGQWKNLIKKVFLIKIKWL